MPRDCRFDRFSNTLPPDLRAEADQYAEKHHETRSSVIRMALKRFLRDFQGTDLDMEIQQEFDLEIRHYDE